MFWNSEKRKEVLEIMDITREIGLRIRYYRKEKHMTQEKLAEICNLHPTYIGQIERGEKNATIESIYRVATGLNIPLSKLLENIEFLDNSSDNIPLHIYQRLLSLPHDKQNLIEKIVLEIIELTRTS